MGDQVTGDAGLTFLYGDYVPRCTHHIDKQFMGYCTLQYMSAGEVELHLGARRYDMSGRWLWSAYPGPRIRFFPKDKRKRWVHRYIAFQGKLVEKWKQEGLFPIPPRPSPGNLDYGPRFDELLRQSRRSDVTGHRRAIHLLEGILLELADARQSRTPPPVWLNQAFEMLGEHLELQDYRDLAARLGISESTFRRQFKQATGTSPHAFVLQRRISEARRLLGETDLPIKAIAGQLGYRDVYFFSRQFRQLTGIPPATYRSGQQL